MTVILNQETYNKLINIQKEFDSRVPEYLLPNIKVAYFVEFMEFQNTLEYFKAWKKNKGKPKDVQLDELADLLAFGTSMTAYHDIEYMEEVFTKFDGESTAREGFTTEGILSECSFLIQLLDEVEGPEHVAFMAIPISIAYDMFTVEELLEAYYNKMDINHSRQDNNY